MPAIIPVTAPELGTVRVVVSFRDPEDDSDITPSSVTWTLTTLDGTVINSREREVVGSPAADTEIMLSGHDLQILAAEADLRYVKRLLTVEAINTTTLTQQFLFQIENFNWLETT